MKTTDTTAEQPENRYNFFDPDLWLARVDGMVWLLRMTYDGIDGMLTQLDGLTVEKCNQLMQEIARQKEDAQIIDLDFNLLEAFLQGLLQNQQLPQSAPDPDWAIDFAFEVKQLINLRSLCITYIYFFADMRQLIAEALSAAPTGQPHPPLYLIQACYRHLAHDCEILQRAFLQRQPSVDTAGKPVAGVLAKELVMTDKLAIKTLAPFAHLLPHPTIFTFFSQETHMRHLPFSDQIILVGLSHARISTIYNDHKLSDANEAERVPLPAFELLAIPHEIGHYMYIHATLGRTDAERKAIAPVHFVGLSEQFRHNPYFHWCEELFADLFGCVIAGPLAVFAMQALLAATDPASMGTDDGEHPTTVVRPYLLSEMLRVLGRKEMALAQAANTQTPALYQFAQVAESLDANWSAVLQQLGFELIEVEQGRPARIQWPSPANAHLPQAIHVAQVIEAVKPIIAEFAGLLLANAHFTPWGADGTDTLSAEIPWVQLDQEYLRGYTAVMADITGATLASQKAPQHSLLTLNFWDAKWQSRLKGATADAKLQHWLDEWDNRGPGTIGGH